MNEGVTGMKVFSVCGITKSGKTTTIEHIIRELAARGYKVGSVKEIHNESFAIDPGPDSNTFRHRQAGSALVTARGNHETDILFPGKMDMRTLLSSCYHGFDYVVLEGVDDIPVPTILTARTPGELADRWGGFVFCVSGVISGRLPAYKGIPSLSAVSDSKPLVDLIERKVYDLLPDIDPDCCRACGCSCRELGVKILAGEARRAFCVADRGVELTIGSHRIDLAPFVQKVLRGTILGVVRELDGFRDHAEIRIKF